MSLEGHWNLKAHVTYTANGLAEKSPEDTNTGTGDAVGALLNQVGYGPEASSELSPEQQEKLSRLSAQFEAAKNITDSAERISALNPIIKETKELFR